MFVVLTYHQESPTEVIQPVRYITSACTNNRLWSWMHYCYLDLDGSNLLPRKSYSGNLARTLQYFNLQQSLLLNGFQ